MPASQGRVVCKLVLISSNILFSPCFSRVIINSHGSSSLPLFLSRRLFSSFIPHGGGSSSSSSNTTMTAGGGGGGGPNFPDSPPPNPIPNRPLRGGGGGGGGGGDNQFHHPPPHLSRNIRNNPNTNRGRPPQVSNDHENMTLPLQSSVLNFLNKSSTDNVDTKDPAPSSSDDNFLNKFKLGVDNKERIAPTPNPQLPLKDGTQPQPQPQPQDADEIFKNMKETGLIPNAVAMLDGLCKDGLVQEAMKLFGLMREKGTIPDVVINTAVVEGFCKAHKPDDAKRIFNKMLSNGISPNAFTYSVLIQGLCKCNKLEDAIDISVEMLQAGHSPNVATFVVLVDGLTREKGVEEARAAIENLKQRGFFLDEKAVREYLDKKAPSMPLVWEALFGKKGSQSQRLF